MWWAVAKAGTGAGEKQAPDITGPLWQSDQQRRHQGATLAVRLVFPPHEASACMAHLLPIMIEPGWGCDTAMYPSTAIADSLYGLWREEFVNMKAHEARELCKDGHGCMQGLVEALENGAAPELIFLDLRNNPFGLDGEDALVRLSSPLLACLQL